MARVTGTKAKAAVFKLYAPKAKRVSLSGSFNNWDTKALTAKKDTLGNWAVKTTLSPGKHEYKFFVDGGWINDPNCKSTVFNAFGSQNSVIEVK